MSHILLMQCLPAIHSACKWIPIYVENLRMTKWTCVFISVKAPITGNETDMTGNRSNIWSDVQRCWSSLTFVVILRFNYFFQRQMLIQVWYKRYSLGHLYSKDADLQDETAYWSHDAELQDETVYWLHELSTRNAWKRKHISNRVIMVEAFHKHYNSWIRGLTSVDCSHWHVCMLVHVFSVC